MFVLALLEQSGQVRLLWSVIDAVDDDSEGAQVGVQRGVWVFQHEGSAERAMAVAECADGGIGHEACSSVGVGTPSLHVRTHPRHPKSEPEFADN